ncbi:MAG: hypothetical protein EHM62_06205 [Methylococcus sp.]|nr:MAG: hypothetical protein EHM62_06205 [Methylococcus sp.]
MSVTHLDHWAATLRTYPYLFANLLALVIILSAVRVCLPMAHRRLTLWMGLLLAPTFAYSPLLTRDYWEMVRLGGWPTGVEDLVCAFSLGTLGCFAGLILFRDRLTVAARPAPRIAYLLAVIAAAQVPYFGLGLLGFSTLSALVSTQFLGAAILLALRPDLRQLALVNVAGLVVIYPMALSLFYWIWPDFVSCWKTTAPWGLRLAGIPLGEMGWAASFGLVWPLIAGVVFDVRLAARPVTPREQPRVETGGGHRGLPAAARDDQRR